MIKKVKLFPSQVKFVNSTSRHTGFVGGFGSGKTKAGIIKTTLKKLEYGKLNVAYYLPTYNLIKDIAVPRISEQLTDLGLSFSLNLSDKFFEIRNGEQNFGKIIMRTMDNPSLIVGYEVAYSLIDECDVLPSKKMNDVFSQIIARNRSKTPNGTRNSTDVVGTPEGFKWFYDFFVRNKKESKSLIRAKTEENPYLPHDYIASLKESYTEAQLKAYLDGLFVPMTSGRVYYNFDKERNHSNEEIKSGDILHVGMDFNVTKMAAVVHVVRGSKLHAVAEHVDAYNTPSMIEILKSNYSNHTISVYPDASGNNRKTMGISDIKELKREGFHVVHKNSNPFVKDRVNNMNTKFLNAKGEISYYVNTLKCPKYTEALEQISYKNEIPDKDSGQDHVTDAGGYCAFTLKSKIY